MRQTRKRMQHTVHVPPPGECINADLASSVEDYEVSEDDEEQNNNELTQ
jgi:hypothetical protein